MQETGCRHSFPVFPDRSCTFPVGLETLEGKEIDVLVLLSELLELSDLSTGFFQSFSGSTGQEAAFQ
jgi:hypothetical protein